MAARLRESSQPLQVARANLSHWSSKNEGSASLLRCYAEWASILDRPVDAICQILCADTEEGDRLRQNSPFAGVLLAQTVWEAKRRIRNVHAGDIRLSISSERPRESLGRVNLWSSVAKRFPVCFDQKVRTHDLGRPSISRA